MAARRESSKIFDIEEYLNGLQRCEFINVHGSAYSKKGTPDIVGCLNGRTFALEVKKEGGEATQIQLKKIRDWIAAGAIAGIVESKDEVAILLWPAF